MDKNLREFYYIDYKKPLIGQDFRTSSYLAHRYLNLDPKIKPHKNKNIKLYTQDPIVIDKRVSEYEAEFEPKSKIEIGRVPNPRMRMKQQFMKPFEDQKFKVAHVMQPAISTSHQDYVWTCLPAEAPPRSLYFNKTIKTTPQIVNNNDNGIIKYLETDATTNKLTYVQRSPKQILSGIAAHDAITYWNWNVKSQATIPTYPKKDRSTCDDAPADRCKRPKTNSKRTVKFVPHNSFTTEMRDNYKGEVMLKELKPEKIILRYGEFQNIPMSDKTENHIYGTGDSTRKYI